MNSVGSTGLKYLGGAAWTGCLFPAWFSSSSESDHSADDGKLLQYVGGGLWNTCFDVECHDNLILLAMAHGLQIYDASDISNPVLISQTYMGGSRTYALAIRWPLVAVRTEDSLVLVDVASISSPRIAGSLALVCQRGGMVFAGDYLYVGCDKDLVTVDVADPSKPFLSDRFEFPANGGDAEFDVVDTLLYIAASRFFVASIADPSKPVIVTTVRWPELEIATDLAIRDSLAYIANHSNIYPPSYSFLTILNLSNPLSPSVVSTYEIQDGADYLLLRDSTVFLGVHSSGIVAFDIAKPESPQITGCFMSQGTVHPCALLGESIVMAEFPPLYDYDPWKHCDSASTGKIPDSLQEPGGIYVLDVSTPSEMTLEGSICFGAYLGYMTLAGDHAYLVDAMDYLVVAKLGADSPPTVINRVKLSDGPRKPFIDDTIMYVPEERYGIVTLNISNPDTPAIMSRVQIPGRPLTLFARDGYVYIADPHYGLWIVDATAPDAPEIIALWSSDGSTWDVNVQGDYAYVADTLFGTQVVNVSNPYEPYLEYQCDQAGAWFLTLRDSLLFSASQGELTVFIVADPRRPVRLASYTTSRLVEGITIDNSFLFAPSGFWRTVTAYDISDPVNIRCAAETTGPLAVWEVAAYHDRVYVLDLEGLMMFDPPRHQSGQTLPASFELSENYPNPFNSLTYFALSLREPAHATVEIHNILGQRIELILDADLPAGTRSLSWDASRFASGVYLCRATVAGLSQSRKMVLIK